MNALLCSDQLDRWRHCRLSLLCPGCNWSATPPVDVLAAELGGRTPLIEVAARLRCRSCGARPELLGLADTLAGPASLS